MRKFLFTATLMVAASLLLAPTANADPDAYPRSPITIIIPFPAGQASDVIVRLMGERMEASLGQPVLVENRPGAGGVVGTTAGAQAQPDGHTLTLATAAYAITPHTHELSFDPGTSFEPVTQFAMTPLVLVANPSLAVDSVADVVAMAKSRPGEVMFASSGSGTSHHLAGELFQSLEGIELLHVPYAGSAQAHVDLIGGRSDIMFDNIVPLVPHLSQGALKALAVTTKERAPLLPDVPTIAEAGLPEYEATAWFGLLAPAGTPRPVVDKIQAAVKAAVETPEVAKRLTEMGVQPMSTGPDEFRTFIASEMTKWGAVVERAGVKRGMQ